MEAVSYRWWENYLVRYFLPSIAGMIIVKWLDENTDQALSRYLFVLNVTADEFGSAHLISWILFGSLYCYIASYPILVFHATRALDFKDARAKITHYLNPIYWTLIFVLLAFFAVKIDNYCFSLTLVLAYSFFQIYRIYKVHYTDGFKNKSASLAYAYLWKLSRRRGIIKSTTTSQSNTAVPSESQAVDDDDSDQTVTFEECDKDLSDSYRHLREHGNTAFIFMLELALCPILYVCLKYDKDYLSLSLLTIALFLWVTPAVFVHLLGQHLERKFSNYKIPQ